jgi:hypothetical protein
MSINYQLTGFSDEDGKMGRLVPVGQIVVPQRIWLKNDCLCWEMGRNPKAREISRSMLNQFIRLSDADCVLRFAREWGVLALSENMSSDDSPAEFYLPGRQRLKKGNEPISAWQFYSRRAQALLNVAAALKQGKLGDMSDWDKFATFHSEPIQHERVMQWVERRTDPDQPGFGFGFSIYNGQGTHEERLRVARDGISSEIGSWLESWRRKRSDAPSDFAVRWIDDQQRWDIQIDYHGLLFPAIALQLALVLADADSLFTCSGCGIPYIRPRERKRPKIGWANYCDSCSEDGVAQRRATESYRQKRAEAVRLYSTGSSVSKIAEELKANPTRVRAWVEKSDKNGKKKTRE